MLIEQDATGSIYTNSKSNTQREVVFAYGLNTFKSAAANSYMTYVPSQTPVSFADAKSACEGRSYFGVNGRMAAVATEADALNLARFKPNGWIGATADSSNAWTWIATGARFWQLGMGQFGPVEGRFGKRAPSASSVVENIAHVTGEAIAPHGAAVANKLGLTTQVPVRSVYITSGRSRQLKLGSQVVELRHAPHWQFALGNQPSGEVLRALAWLGPEKAGAALRALKRKLSASELRAIASARSMLPSWLAEQISEVVVNG